MGSTEGVGLFGIMAKGSPPYTWGAPIRRHLVGNRKQGITPIYMGSTKMYCKLCKVMGDHPHIHGEHCLYFGQRKGVKGSPPYTWGARVVKTTNTATVGITPIYMGSTQVPLLRCYTSEDHPHIHGEHALEIWSAEYAEGSPPYTWGAPAHIGGNDQYPRITPIYMGSTR